MRVIAGSLKGRRLKSPDWLGVRPTSDKLRETLFNILGDAVDGARLLDAFAGSGANGIEAMSRGAREVVFIDQDRRAERLIAENATQCGIRAACAIIRASVGRGLEQLGRTPGFVPFDIVLLDPPYRLAATEALTGIDTVTRVGGVVILEHARRDSAPEMAGRLVRTREVASGDSALTFYIL